MINKMLGSKRGASSIMVMLMLVVLVVFGIAALTTALSNIRLGQKVVDWNENYYTAEGIANERYAVIDDAVRQAFSSGGSITDNLTAELNSLGLDVLIDTQGSAVHISYEAWSGNIGISVMLSFDTDNAQSLHAVQWKEIQK